MLQTQARLPRPFFHFQLVRIIKAVDILVVVKIVGQGVVGNVLSCQGITVIHMIIAVIVPQKHGLTLLISYDIHQTCLYPILALHT